MTTNQPRKPAGTPAGGQWAPVAHDEPDVKLSPVTPSQLRRAALAIAKGRHPDQAGSIHKRSFTRRSDYFASVHMTGGNVLVMRDDAEARARQPEDSSKNNERR